MKYKTTIFKGLFVCLVMYLVIFQITPLFINVSAKLTKSHVEIQEKSVNYYLKDKYGNAITILSTELNKKEFPNTVVSSIQFENEDTYDIYYDVNYNLVLFDEYAMEQSISENKRDFAPILENNPDIQLKDKKSLLKAISAEENIVNLYEYQIEKENVFLYDAGSADELDLKNHRLVQIQNQLEEEYQYIGDLYIQYDKLTN